MYVIYLDVLFMINWVMDFLIFYSVTMILNKWLPLRRHLYAATLASFFYCLLVLVPLLRMIPYSLYSLWIPVIPILLLYRPTTIKLFLKYYLISMVVAAIYGGVIFSLWFMLGGSMRKLHSMQIVFLFGISIMVAALFYLCFYWLRRCFVLRHFSYAISLSRMHRKKEMLALMDTGNMLYAPMTHEPVIVITYEAAEALLSSKEIEVIKRCYACSEQEVENYLSHCELRPDVIIPFNSVGCEASFLWGIYLDELTISMGKHKKFIKHCIAGIAKNPLYADRQYEVLLHPEYILEGERVV